MLFDKMVSKEGGSKLARSVPDKRRSGVERPGPVGPSAFVSVVFQEGVVYPLSSFVLVGVPSSKFLSSGLTLTAPLSGESLRCCVASFLTVAT